MDESSIRLECLKMALEWDGDDDGQVVERARVYAGFVLGVAKPFIAVKPTAAVARGLLGEIDDFLGQTLMADSTFGQSTVNSRSFVARLRQGCRCNLATARKVREQMAVYRANGRFNPIVHPPRKHSAAPADFAQAAE